MRVLLPDGWMQLAGGGDGEDDGEVDEADVVMRMGGLDMWRRWWMVCVEKTGGLMGGGGPVVFKKSRRGWLAGWDGLGTTQHTRRTRRNRLVATIGERWVAVMLSKAPRRQVQRARDGAIHSCPRQPPPASPLPTKCLL